MANVTKLKKFKISLEDIISSHQKSLTIADLVSHLMATNNLNDIISNLSVILNEDFGQLLKDFVLFNKPYYSLDCDEIFKWVNKTFELRNIYVHEYAFKVPIIIKEIKNIIDNSYLFIFISEVMIHKKNKNPGEPGLIK